MSAAQPHRARADDTPAFDSTMYYTIRNVADLNFGLSSGENMQPQGLVDTEAAGSLSSENWQFFYQSGRYFIRNRDYGAGWQLGLTPGNSSQPQLYPVTTGERNLQWTVTKVDLGWQLANGLLGAGPVMVLNPSGALPLMQLGGSNGVWNITKNPTAVKDKPLTGVWTSSIQNFETVTPTPSSTPSIATPTTLSSALLTSTPSSTLPPTTIPTSSSSSSSRLSTPAIAGIVLGVLVLLIAVLAALYLLIVKKRRKQKHGTPYEVHGDTAAPPLTEKYAHTAELASPLAELAGHEREGVGGRVELSAESAGGRKG